MTEDDIIFEGNGYIRELEARIAELEAALKDAAELLSDAHGDIGRGGYGLGYTAARAALEKKNED